MTSRPSRSAVPAARLAAALLALAGASAALAQSTPAATPAFGESPANIHWELTVSPYAYHWKDDPDHRHVGLIGVERVDSADNSLWGLSLFSNSFGQPSAYAYYGHEWNGIFNQPSLYVKVSAGLIYGYKGKYEDKVPFNYKGFAPAIIPAIGWRITDRDAVQAAVFGTAGVLFAYNRKF